MKTPVNPIQVLIDHACGRVHHINLGSCPDILEGYDSRDSDCPVCCAIDATVQPATTFIRERAQLEQEWCGLQQLKSVHPIASNERILDCAQRLVDHADFQLGGILSADSKAKDIPSRATSIVKARHLAALCDALRNVTQPVQPTPPGWKLVPVSPTEEMIRAGVKEREGQAVYKSVSRAGTLIFEGNAAFEYCAMLAAAPVYGIGSPGAPSSTGDVK